MRFKIPSGNLIGAVDCHSVSYITLKELNAIDWEEEADSEDTRIRIYDEENNLVMKAAGIGELSKEEERKIRNGEEVVKELDHDSAFLGEEGSKRYYRLERMQKKDALSRDWEDLIELMQHFGDQYDDKNVRLVVWFDN